MRAKTLPPGLAVFSASERALARAKSVEGRGYYFDFLEFAANDDKDNTPSTPCISLVYALEKQLERFFAEGLEQRWNRHRELAAQVRQWVERRGLNFFVEEPYRSVTLTCVANNRGIDLKKLKGALGERGYAFDDGYGKLKGETFRIAHMGDLLPGELKEFIALIDELTPGF